MGRKAINTQKKIEDEKARVASYKKRKPGLLKKACEFSALFEEPVTVVFSSNPPEWRQYVNGVEVRVPDETKRVSIGDQAIETVDPIPAKRQKTTKASEAKAQAVESGRYSPVINSPTPFTLQLVRIACACSVRILLLTTFFWRSLWWERL